MGKGGDYFEWLVFLERVRSREVDLRVEMGLRVIEIVKGSLHLVDFNFRLDLSINLRNFSR